MPAKLRPFLQTLLFSILAMICFKQNHVYAGGSHVPSGGDQLRLNFDHARFEVARHIQSLTDCSFLPQVSQEFKTWILKNQDQLVADIKNSNHEWVREELPTCAETSIESKATIRLSFPTCLKATKLPREIERLLIHESIHHLGVKSEKRTDELAGVIQNAATIDQCPSQSIIEKPQSMLSGFFDTCVISGGNKDCLKQDGFVSQMLNQFNFNEVSDYSYASSQSFCIIQSGIPKCLSRKTNRDSFEVIKEVGFPRHTQKVFSIQVNNSLSGCLFDQAGLACWTNSWNSRLSQFNQIRDYSLSDHKVCIVENNKGLCADFSSSLNFQEISGLTNPRSVNVFGGTAVFIDDFGLAIVGSRGKIKERHKNLTYPSLVAVSHYPGRICVVDQGSLFCKSNKSQYESWKRILTAGKVLELNVSGDKICYISENFWDCL